eukprot:g3276.t1
MASITTSSSTTTQPTSIASNEQQDNMLTIIQQRYQQFQMNQCLSSTVSIPKIIHFIWLGSPFPTAKYYERFYKTWELLNPTFEIILWNDERVQTLRQEKELMNHKAFDLATNYGEKSDILRLELLYRYGGIYVDVDFKCIKPFESFCNTGIDLFIGESNVSTNKMELNNALIGCIPTHPIVLQLMKTIQPDPKVLVAKMMNIPVQSSPMSTIERTGPLFITNVLLHPTLKLLMKYKNILILPKEYFYPIPNHIDFNIIDHGDDEINKYYNENTFAVHRWGKSWQ